MYNNKFFEQNAGNPIVLGLYAQLCEASQSMIDF